MKKRTVFLIAIAMLILAIVLVNLYYLPKTLEFTFTLTDPDGASLPATVHLTRWRYLDDEPLTAGTLKIGEESFELCEIALDERDGETFFLYLHTKILTKSVPSPLIRPQLTIVYNEFDKHAALSRYDDRGDSETERFAIAADEWPAIIEKIKKFN